MKPQKREMFFKVKQLITTDDINAANVFLESGDCILVDTYKQSGHLFYVVSRIKDYEEDENESNLE